jgi:hypothetical protein
MSSAMKEKMAPSSPIANSKLEEASIGNNSQQLTSS